MSEENLTPETETAEATAPAVEEVKAPEPKVEPKVEVVEEVVAEVSAQAEAVPLPGRGSMGVVSPETGIKVKL